ncbi:MAG: S8 family serine peptidase, partial [Anaerolineae bacterium]|nr:S8 family serine peptidase [Anaerolineae bacterium]
MSRKAVSLVTLICLVGLLVPNLSASAANPTPDGPPQVVRVPATAMAQVEALELAPYLSLDYGSYHWLELGSADYARLAASQVPFVSIPEAGQLQVQGYRFDPLWNGEPALSAGMRAEGSGPGLRLIQLTGPAQDRWLVQLEAAGLKPLQYYPHNTYLVWATAAEAEAATALDFVRWQGAFHPGYKIDRELDRRTGPIHNVDVMFYNDGLIDATLDALTALGATVLNSYPSQPDKAFYDAVVQIDAAALADVARLNTVLWLGYLSPEPILDDEMSSQIVAGNYVGGVPQIGYFPWLTGLGYDGSGVRWAIVDTGVDWDHPDLGPHIAGGYDFPGACSYPGEPGSDCTGGGHGTHVAGIVGGDATAGYTDSQGFYYGLGIAPGYEIFAMNSLSASAWPPAGGWQEHSKRAVLGGAIGGNNSWTTGEGTDHGYQASERTHDFMVRDGNFDTPSVAEPFIEVFSAGNSGSSGLTAPKEAKNLIVVASSRNYRVGNIDTLSSFSSWGPAVDGRWVPTVAAPGEQIASTRNDLGGSCSTPIPGTNNMYAYCSGTSMAAPHVSGSITLLTEWWRTFNAGADPSPAMAKALLVSGAVDMNEGHAIPNIYEGWGRVHLTNVMDNDTLMYYQDQQHTFDNTGESWTITLGVPDPSKPLKVSVAWSDAPGMVGANPALVNNLDLTVENGGNTYLGNHFSGGWSTPGGSADAINNLENVFVQAPGGLATITIQATNLPGDGVPISGDTTDQDFALVCYNCAQMTIELVKTVGTNPNACATTDEIAVPPGSEVTYCYEVTNTGIEDLATHDLTDSELGDLLIGFPYTLAPGASTFLTQTATITQTTLNVATWTAYDAAGASVSDSDSALVTIQPPAIELTKTVGTDPATCATTDAIEVAPGTDVYYCYEVQNTGAYTLPLHDLVDSELG